MDAATRLEGLCYGGEELLASEPLASGAMGVTTHRLLLFTPEAAGTRLRAIDRPNVTGLAIHHDGPAIHRDRAVQTGIVGIGLFVAGSLIDLGGVINPVESPTNVRLGGLLGLIDALIVIFELVDEVLILLGMVGILGAVVSSARYLRNRDRVLEVGIAGDEPLRVPLARGETPAIDRLQAALGRAEEPGPAPA